ncbi:hypothetical protein [Rhizobium leguminosarum]|uniref:hypothetical protein n=1 Tax=Rhizobium leguminosarum TaxID=384 RepID=UPI000FEC622F|nr:hypothetical protein [Rhizobium leguminosarum]RWX30525.1 hypothetical protein EHI43_20855 [Rhizobium leguminosarum]
MTDKHAPDSLKYQWRLLGLVLRSKWATGLDKALAYEIIDNYRKAFGNSRASLSYLQKASGADRKAVIASTRRLVENGPFSVIRAGAGTRPTEYKLHFELVQENASSGLDTTTMDVEPSSGAETTTGGGAETTTRSASSGAETTESVLPVAAYKAGIQDRMIDPAPPSAPLPVGLTATGADDAGGGFEKVWKAYYPTRGQGRKADAREAYGKLNPDYELHLQILEAAREWYGAWAAQDNETAPRKHLNVWLREESYECHPPAAYKPKERKAKAPAADGNVAEQAKAEPDFSFYPDHPASGTIEKADLAFDDEDGARMLTVWFRTTDGADVEWMIVVESPDEKEQDRGQLELQRLLLATALSELSDPDDLVGRKVDLMVTHQGNFVSCSPPWVPAPKEPRNFPSFTDVVNRTQFGGWATKIGTAVDAEDTEREAA